MIPNARLSGLLMIVALFFLSQRANAAQSPEASPKVRVRVASVAFPLRIASSGLKVEGIDVAPVKSAAFMKGDWAQIFKRRVAGQNLWFVQQGGKFLRFSHRLVRLDSSEGKIKLGVHTFPSPVFISSQNSRVADVILSLPLEKYLEGVIGAEMSPSWPLEALKAQAVAARSYTLYQIAHKQNEVFQLEGDVLDQVYSVSSNAETVKKALEETRGMVLEQNHKILKAYYHSDCGGQTEEPQNVWGVSSVKFKAVRDKYCRLRNPWTVKFSKDEILSKLSEKYDLNVLDSIVVLTRTPSRRVALVAMGGGGQRVTLSGQELRKMLGFDKIKSTLFSLTTDANSVTFTGRGSGHGSGLCQWGSRDLAQEGFSYERILSHYYPNAQLIHLPDVQEDTPL